MNRQPLSLIIFFLWIVGCDVSALFPAVAPTYTPDRIGTRVAEEKAVPSTLTIDASKLRQTPLPTETAKPASTQVPTLTITPVLLALTPTMSLVKTGRVEGTIPRGSGIKVTLCNGYFIKEARAIWCGKFEQRVTIDLAGYFLFPEVPAGEYYIFFDIPEELKDIGPLCSIGAFSSRGPLANGDIRDYCISGESMKGALVVEPGKTTNYPRR